MKAGQAPAWEGALPKIIPKRGLYPQEWHHLMKLRSFLSKVLWRLVKTVIELQSYNLNKWMKKIPSSSGKFPKSICPKQALPLTWMVRGQRERNSKMEKMALPIILEVGIGEINWVRIPEEDKEALNTVIIILKKVG
jgi:hypothetical protein